MLADLVTATPWTKTTKTQITRVYEGTKKLVQDWSHPERVLLASVEGAPHAI
jgi:hypothetical protein